MAVGQRTREREREVPLLMRATEALLLAAHDEQAVLATATTLLGDHFGYGARSVLLYDKTADELVMGHAAGPGSDDPETVAWRRKLGEGLSGIAAKTRTVVNVGDLQADPRTIRIGHGQVSRLCVPMLVRDELLGVVVLESPSGDAFNAHDEELMRAFSHVTALALIHARADQRRRATIEQLSALHEVSRRLAEASRLGEVLSYVLDGAIRLTGAEGGLVWRLDDRGDFFLAASQNLPADRIAQHPPNAPDSVSRRIMASGRTLRVPDIQPIGKARWPQEVPHLHALLGIPLRSEGRAYGSLLVVHRAVDFFRPEHERVLEVMAAQAAAAIARAEALEEAQRLAITDALTGLYNARYLTGRLDAEIQRAERYGHPLALLFVDSDALKRVNDKLGHAAGNDLLVALARAIRESVRATDLVARFGGDEFVVVQPETGLEAAVATAERIRKAAYAASDLAGIERSVSVGVATYPGAARTGDALFKEADRALYEAKRAGKNRVVSTPTSAPES